MRAIGTLGLVMSTALRLGVLLALAIILILVVLPVALSAADLPVVAGT